MDKSLLIWLLSHTTDPEYQSRGSHIDLSHSDIERVDLGFLFFRFYLLLSKCQNTETHMEIDGFSYGFLLGKALIPFILINPCSLSFRVMFLMSPTLNLNNTH